MTDWGHSGRHDEFSVVRVDPFTLEEVGSPLDIVPEDCSLTWAEDTDTKLSGTISFAGVYTHGTDYLLRVRQHTECDGTVSERVIATMFVRSSPSTGSMGLEKTECDCYSILLRYSEDKLVSDFFRSAGSGVLEALTTLVESRGGRLSIGDGVDTSRTFAEDYLSELGTGILDTMQQIAEGIGCEIEQDAYGYVVLRPHVEPAMRPVAYAFEDGENCVYLDGATRDGSDGDSVNRILYVYSSNDTTVRALADLPDGYRGSFARTGRYRTDIVKYSEYVTDSEMQNLAWSDLMERCGVMETYEISHIDIPELYHGARVSYSDSHNFSEAVVADAVISSTTLESFAEPPMRTTKLVSVTPMSVR